MSKCFERLIRNYINTLVPKTLDHHQFAYQENISTEDAISTVLHNTLAHLEKDNTYVRMLFIDYSSAFNTIIPSRLVNKLSSLGFPPDLCNLILDFLSNRRQVG